MIKVENVNYHYGNFKALKSISIKGEKKKFVGIIGPNGSGKSTLLKCIYRVLKPETGVIYLDDQPVHQMTVQDSAKEMAVVAQHNHSSFDFQVEEMVLMGRTPYKKMMSPNTKEDYDILEAVLRQVDMTDFRKRMFSTLSGGEQQRIILARALAQEPNCLILDEPTNHLDIKHQLMMLNIVRGLNVSVVAAIHDMNIALNYCDYVYVMNEGEIAYEGHPEDIITPETIQKIFGVTSKILESDDEKAIVFKEVTS